MHDRAADYFRSLQDRICTDLAELDGTPFREDSWERPGGGGGRTRVLVEGSVFEKAGVNFSEVSGEMADEFAKQIPGEGTTFTATGISLVLHPRNPHVPTVHMNYRYLTKGPKQWFGGGADLTPYYPVREDVVHFHRTLRDAVTPHEPLVEYAKLKRDCDDYFFLKHRNEPRGVGGIFFDYLDGDPEQTFALVRSCGDAFLPAYLPIVMRRKGRPYSSAQRQFQQFRRGRYVEFNLLYDRGTVFGLKTAGRVESILMSLPPTVRWEYDFKPEPDTPEAELYEVYLTPRDWAGA